MDEDRDRERDEEDGELRPRQERKAESGRGKEIPAWARLDDRPIEGERRPEEGRVRGCLAHEDAGQHHPGHHDARDGDHERPRPIEKLPAEQVRRDGGTRHQEGIEHVRSLEGVRRRQRADHRREEQGVELVRSRNRGAVDRRQRRMGLGDRQRQLDVLQLVGHHGPVADPAREPEGEDRAGRQPEQDRPHGPDEPGRAGQARHGVQVSDETRGRDSLMVIFASWFSSPRRSIRPRRR